MSAPKPKAEGRHSPARGTFFEGVRPCNLMLLTLSSLPYKIVLQVRPFYRVHFDTTADFPLVGTYFTRLEVGTD